MCLISKLATRYTNSIKKCIASLRPTLEFSYGVDYEARNESIQFYAFSIDFSSVHASAQMLTIINFGGIHPICYSFAYALFTLHWKIKIKSLYFERIP